MRFFIGICFGVGLYLLLADHFRIPSLATSKAYNNLAKRQEKKTSTLDILSGSATSRRGFHATSSSTSTVVNS